MNRKIVGMCVCMLVIATALPAIGTINSNFETNVAPLQPPGVDWVKTYGGEEFNWLFDINPTDDGGYIAGGVFEYQDRMCAWMLKTNENGNETWSAINDLWYGTSPILNEIGVQCVLQVDDGFIAGGYGLYYNSVHGYETVVGYLWKVNTAGETQWLKALANDIDEWAVAPFGVVQVDDELIFSGWFVQITTYPDFFLDIALFKTDMDGNLDLDWIHTYDAGGFDYARSIWPTTDGGYFLAGGTEEPNPFVEYGAYYMVKTDSNGVEEWNKTFDGPGDDWSGVRGCRQTDDGGYIQSGMSFSWGDGDQDAWVVKTDASGNMMWNKTYGSENNEHCYGMDAANMSPTEEGYVFVIVKNAWKMSEPKEDLWIIETDKEGNLEYELQLEEDGTQWLQGIHQIEDKGFILVGRNGVLTSTDCSGVIMEIAPFPHFEIEINGGLGVNAVITNDGYGDAVNVPYKIHAKGGFLGLVNKTKTGLVNTPTGGSQNVSTGMFLGFGKISISVKVGVKEKTATGFVIGPFIFGVKVS